MVNVADKRGAVTLYPYTSNFQIITKVRYFSAVGYDRNQNIRLEPEPDTEFRFRLTGTGSDSENSGSGYTNRNWYAQIPVPVPAGYRLIQAVAVD